MSTSSMMNTSSGNSGRSGQTSRGGRTRDRGLPISCRCGVDAIIRTSATVKNPGRLFHCCPKGSEKDNCHLFKWTDESLVEEVEDMKETLRSLDVDINRFDKDNEHLKKIVDGYEKVIGALQVELQSCEEVIKDIACEVRILKTLIGCGVALVVGYYFFQA